MLQSIASSLSFHSFNDLQLVYGRDGNVTQFVGAVFFRVGCNANERNFTVCCINMMGLG